jgi:predicted DNA-binding transcriptional regulator AlpA
MADTDTLLFTPPELAAILKVSNETLTDWRRDQLGPSYFMIGGQVRYPWSDVCAWMNARRRVTKEQRIPA